MIKRHRIRVTGIVQGVGFRPFVYRLANESTLVGWVNNDSEGVLIELQGEVDHLDRFATRLQSELPPLARISELSVSEIQLERDDSFRITASSNDNSSTALIPPDIATCDDCLRELFDPEDRRYRYPFINCTNCGPRYTIVRSVPYDRPMTSMDKFDLCPACSKEYHDPGNRRFHAQPNACADCGPSLTMRDHEGTIETDDPIAEAARRLRCGDIVALKGIGGFHLVVDPSNQKAIDSLRQRKGRAEKPLALMSADLESIRKYCRVSPEEASLLVHHARPIVLLERKPEAPIADSVAPGNSYLGFMLAYSPIHHLLLRENFDALVMTSGNLSEEPIAIDNDEAIERLTELADCFVMHDRPILQRCDDSIARTVCGAPQVLRRARGYVPDPIYLEQEVSRPILAVGGELKNCIALAKGREVVLSQHVGDLDNPSAMQFFQECIEHLCRVMDIEPELIAHDLHPEYLSTKYALKQTGVESVGVQHHHAHLVSVMADNSVTERTIGLILDGTGYGTDGTIWGGEILVGDASGFERFGWLDPVMLPGGTMAIKQPWRMAVSYLYHTYGESFRDLNLPALQSIPANDQTVVLQMMEKSINSPLTSSCGRLFDGISALLSIRNEINYEAQAAIMLEMAAAGEMSQAILEKDNIRSRIKTGGEGSIDIRPLIRMIVDMILARDKIELIAARFHVGLVELLLNRLTVCRDQHGLNTVALSGGVHQNVSFAHYLLDRLKQERFNCIRHRQVPANDGGLALGQLLVADHIARQE